MKDKKIIIDDINVSECKCYNPNIKMDCLLYPLQSDACKNNPNCHYKLYKRKEQECEELKEINQELLKYRKHSTTCQECYEDGLEDGKTSNKELRKLRKTLAEIKPILEYYESSKIGEIQEDGTYKLEFTPSDIATPFCIKFDPKPAREALKKINEVENDKSNN